MVVGSFTPVVLMRPLSEVIGHLLRNPLASFPSSVFPAQLSHLERISDVTKEPKKENKYKIAKCQVF